MGKKHASQYANFGSLLLMWLTYSYIESQDYDIYEQLPNEQLL